MGVPITRPSSPGPRPASPNLRPWLRQRGSLFLALAVLLADQISKSWVLSHLALGEVRPFLPGLLALQRVRNTGAAFSLFSGSIQILSLVSLVVSAGVLVWIISRPPQGVWPNLALGFLLGGASGNGIDRWRHGAVTDFLATVPFSFPVFNLADVAINLAVICLAIDQLLPLVHRPRARPSGRDDG